MKKIVLLFSMLLVFASASIQATVNVKQLPAEVSTMKSEVAGLPTEFQNFNVDQFLTLTPSKYKELTGKKLGLKNSIALKVAQWKVKKVMEESTPAGGGKSQLIALLLCFFLGGLGIHRFYLGYTWQGVVQLLTAGGCGIWALVDLIMIITGDLKPKNGDYTSKL